MLFICTGNSARSQMAEGLLRDLAGDRYEAHSAGTDPKPEVHPLAVVAMREVGLDLSGAAPKDLEQFEGQAFDLVVTVCDHARESCPVSGARRARSTGASRTRQRPRAVRRSGCRLSGAFATKSGNGSKRGWPRRDHVG